jgi:hypothetical protein
VGKAHFGARKTPGADPKNLGFDVNIAGHAPGGPGSFLGTDNFGDPSDPGWDVPGLEAYHGKDIYLTEALTIEALQAMDTAVADGVPFFLYMSHYAVHAPFAPDKRYYHKYKAAGLTDVEAMYASMIEGMDESLGDILDNVDRHGLTDDTIVIFVSDNGGFSLGVAALPTTYTTCRYPAARGPPEKGACECRCWLFGQAWRRPARFAANT